MTLRVSSNQGNQIHSNIRRNDTDLRKQFRNLVSGKRINEAADDVGRVAHVENFEQQIRGYSRAARNAYEGIHLARTGDGVLAEASNVLQSMRELAIKSASDTHSKSDRTELNESFSELKSTLKHVTNNSQVFGQNVVGDDFLGQKLQIEMTSFHALNLEIRPMDPSQFARTAVRETKVMSHEALNRVELQVNDVGIRSTIPEDDQLSTSLNSASAIAKAAAINDFSHLTNVVADVLETERVGASDAQGGRLDIGHELIINGVTFSGIDVGIETNDELMITLNHHRNETGVTAAKDASGRIVLTAEDGRNIEVVTRGNAHLITGLRATEGSDVTTGQLRLSSDETTFIGARDGFGAEAKVGLAQGDIIGKAFQKSVVSLDISTRKQANRSLEAIDNAFEELLQGRAYFGGLENRLGATVSRLNRAGQNAYKGKSTIADADFAAETAALARNQVLRQSYTLMLKQSNQLPNRILELL